MIRAGTALIHARQQVRWGGRMRLAGAHLIHEVGGVHRLVLGLRVEQLRVERVAEEGGVDCLVLTKVAIAVVVALGEEVEVDVVGVGVAVEVERVGSEIVALGAKLRAALVGNGAVGGQVGVVEGGLVRELLRLGGRVLGIERLPRCRHLVEGVRVGEGRIKT